MGADVAGSADVPRYVAIITDGNGRWAKRRGLPVVAGHEAGADTVKARLRDAVDLGVKELTVYSFSTENWSRADDEVAALMRMFGRRIERETPELHDEGVRMRFIGRRAAPVAPELIERMDWAEEPTARQRPDHAVRRVQLRRPGGDRRCGANLYRDDRGGVPRAPVRARDARPGPDHPHQRRAADLELPAVAVGVLGARVPRRAVAGLLARGVRAERSTSSPRAGAASAAADVDGRRQRRCRPGAPAVAPASREPPRGARARRATAAARQRSDLLAAGRWSRSRPAIIAIVVRRPRRAAVGAAHDRDRLRLPARALPAARPLAAGAGRRLRGARGDGARGALRQRCDDVLEVAVATLPVTFLVVIARGQRGGATVAIAGTLLGVCWIGFAFAHAVLLRQLPHGGGIVIDVLVGTFLGDTGAYLGGRLFGRRPLAPAISPNKTVEGLVLRDARSRSWRCSSRASTRPGCTQGDALAARRSRSRSLGPIGDLFESLVKRDAGREGRRQRCSAPTAARSTASTRCCSRSSPATTSGSRSLTSAPLDAAYDRAVPAAS